MGKDSTISATVLGTIAIVLVIAGIVAMEFTAETCGMGWEPGSYTPEEMCWTYRPWYNMGVFFFIIAGVLLLAAIGVYAAGSRARQETQPVPHDLSSQRYAHLRGFEERHEQPQRRYCRECGRLIDSTKHFCQNCGAPTH